MKVMILKGFCLGKGRDVFPGQMVEIAEGQLPFLEQTGRATSDKAVMERFKQQLADQADAEKKAQAANKDRQKAADSLKDAETKAAKIKADAEKQAAEIVEAAKADAEKQAAEIVEAAKKGGSDAT